MNFDIPEELKMVQSLVRDFVRDQLRPLERDLLGRAAALADARASLAPEDEERLQKLAQEVGLWGLGVPEEMGGMGLGALGQCLAEEEMAQTIVPFSFGDVTPLLFECNAGQRRHYFEPHFGRRRQALIALMEPAEAGGSGPGAASGFPNLRTTARTYPGGYVIDGAKMSFSRPGPDLFAIVFATTASAGDPAAGGASGAPPVEAGGSGHTPAGDPAAGAPGPGATCLLVDGGTPGFTLIGGGEPRGWRTQVRAPLILSFAGCRVPQENVLGTPGQAFRLAGRWLPARRLVRGARSVGVGQRLLEEARTHVESWQSFGQQVFRRPGVESALADIAISLHACRLLLWEAACKADAGGNIKRDAAMVKLLATQTIRTVADRVSHLFGGPPFIQGLPMQRLCADALATSAVDLALEVQGSIIAADIMKGLRV